MVSKICIIFCSCQSGDYLELNIWYFKRRIAIEIVFISSNFLKMSKIDAYKLQVIAVTVHLFQLFSYDDDI